MNQLNDDNEKLQKQVTAKDGGQDSGAEAEIRRLRAENAALQKSLTSKSLSTSFNNLSENDLQKLEDSSYHQICTMYLWLVRF